MHDPIDPSDSFHTTQWSLIHRAGGAAGPTMRGDALAELLHRYLPALRSHLLMRWRLPADQADELVQGFILKKVLEYDLLARADETRGKFRTLLLTSLGNYVRNELARRRSPGSLATPDDLADDLADGRPGPGADFDLPWAKALLTQAIARMKTECSQGKRADLWGVFDARILGPTLRDEPALDYPQLVARFRFASPAQASNVLMTAKRMFERILRSLICEYAGDDAEIESEISDLRRVLSRARSG